MMALSSPLSGSLAVHGVGQTFLPSLKKKLSLGRSQGKKIRWESKRVWCLGWESSDKS